MAWIKSAASRLGRFHRDEQGDEGVNKILIIALIAIPLVILLIVFKDKLVEWWDGAVGDLDDAAGP